jgi:hypothetical protein
MLWTGRPWYCWPTPQDIAVVAVDAEELAAASVVPLKATRFAKHTESLGDDLYFVQGWPGLVTRFSLFAGPGFLARSQPYGGWLTTETTWPHFDAKVHIATTYPMTEIIDERWKPTNLLLPGGMSGSLLSKTNRIRAAG